MSEKATTPRVVLVTGSGSGIGEAVVRHFREHGHQVLAVDYNAQGRASAEAVGAVFFQADLTDGDACRAAVQEAIQRFGRVDILINNAGYLEHFKEVAEADVGEWWKSWEVNIKGPFLVTRAFLPLLLESENGEKIIVNVSSRGAHLLFPGCSGYQVSRFPQ